MLEGVRIISLCHWLQGPAGAQYLADMGAEVIKVEPVGGAHERRWSGADVFVGGLSGFYLCANKNKQSICLNLKEQAGRDVFLRLVADADVVMENFRPGTMERLGLGFDVLKQARPDIIFASASGYGADGPYAKLPGQDLLVQARTGLMAATAGQRPGILPAAAGCAAIDQHGGALFALGILGAVVRKLKTGQGTRVESNLFNAGIDLQQESLTCYLNGDKTPAVFDRDPHLATWFHGAPYGIYETKDRRYIALCLNPLAMLYKALGCDDLPKEAHFDLYLERDAIAEDLAHRIAHFDLEALEMVLTEHDIWFAPVKNYSELAVDPQAVHNGIFGQADIGDKRAILINHPNRYDGEVPALRHLACEAGQDSQNILVQHGFSAHQIEALIHQGVVA